MSSIDVFSKYRTALAYYMGCIYRKDKIIDYEKFGSHKGLPDFSRVQVVKRDTKDS